jgi:membrane-bound inhibitor of C-type lysozyme
MQNITKYLIPILASVLTLILGMWIQRKMHHTMCTKMGGKTNEQMLCIKEVLPVANRQKNDAQNVSPMMVTYYCPDRSVIMVTHNTEPSAPVEVVDVFVKLGDGKELRFKAVQTVSGSGAKYVSEDEMYTYWNKGNECTIFKGEEVIHSSCISPE